MLKYFLVLALSFASLPLSTAAFADTVNSTCENFEGLDGSVSIGFTKVLDEKNKPTYTVTSKFTLDGEDLPSVRTPCYFKDVPGQRGFLCAHQAQGSNVRYEIYPRFEINDDRHFTGTIRKLQVLRWEDEKVTRFETMECEVK